MKPTTISCVTCQRQLVATDLRKMYCSAACNGKAQCSKRKRIRDTFPPIKCWQCAAEFKPYSKRHHFCSDKCKTTWGNAHKSYEHVCVGCATAFTSRSPTSKYCTRSCALQYTVVSRVLTCIDCGTKFDFIGRTRKRRCDACHKLYWNDYYADAMQDRGTTGWGLDSDYASTKTQLSAEHRQGYRTISREAWGSNCLVCGAKPDGAKCIDVHHVDGDLTNIAPSNLIPLCRRCHGRVHSIARNRTFATRVTPDTLVAALFSFWPEGPAIIGIIVQQCTKANTANSENAKPETGLANAELGP